MYLGVDLGGINIAVGLVDDSYHIVKKESVPTGRLRPFEEIMKDMADLCKKVTEDAGYTMADVKSIGIGSPGTPDVENCRVVYTNNIVNFVDVAVGAELRKYFPGMDVYLENDANAAAYGEILAGAARSLSNAVMVTLGTGVGGGVIIDNKIYAGFNHAGSEIGHMVITYDGEPCTCGRKGCLEAYASATALISQTAKMIAQYPDSVIHQMIDHNPENINGKTAFDAMRAGDEAGKRIVEQYLNYLGAGLANIVNLFQPEAIVIGGGISKEGETILAPLRKYVAENSYTCDVPSTKLITAELGNDAGIVGAAFLWKQAQ